jgi:PAS domain S-box-containing protein
MNDNHSNGAAATRAFLAGGGSMGALMRAHDWASTPLGPIDSWPQSLRSAISICLNSRYPIALYWGPSLALLYNEAWSPILGAKHPWALGRPAHEVWPEIWDTIGPLYERVFATGDGVWQEDELLPMYRHGYTEECYFNFTFSPVRGEGGGVEGVFNAVVETTLRVIGERRTHALRSLAERTAGAKSVETVRVLAIEALQAAEADIPFALLYLHSDDEGEAHLAGSVRLDPGTAAAPRVVHLDRDDGEADRWHLRNVARTGRPELLTAVVERFGALPGGAWPESPSSAYVMPIGLPDRPAFGSLVAGISARRAWDDEYRGFLEQLAGTITTALANARAYEDERERAEALAELDRAKTTFFSNISHEFRTPLTLLLSPVEEILTDEIAPELRDRLSIVHRNALRMQKLVNALLDFSRIEAGRMQAVYVPTDLADTTRDLASTFHSAVEKAGLRYVVDLEDPGTKVYVDRSLWEKIVFNLLSNALKYTLEGEIEVRLRSTRGTVQLIVRDTGIGIPAAELPRMFERFHRIQNPRARTQEGTGIGLALVQELVKLHGGTISVDSVEGEGTTFTVSIPLGSEHLPADRIGTGHTSPNAAVAPGAYISELIHDEMDVPAGQEPVPSEDLPRVVLADDNADMREYVKRLLSRNFHVEAFPDGVEALAAIRRSRPELVITDVMMPRMDGFELLGAIRRDARLEALPVIMLSARAGEEARIDGIQAGADDYIVKPFSARELLVRARSQVELSRVRADAQRRIVETEAQLSSIFNVSSVGMAQIDPFTRRFQRVNAALCSITGFSEAELLAMTVDDLTHAEDRALAAEMFDRMAQGSGAYELEKRYVRKSGEAVWVHATGNTIRDAAGHPLRQFAVIHDISERKAVEEALRQREEKLREADRMKDEFLAMLSHELRTPLTATIGWADLLRAGVLSPEEREIAIETIRSSARVQGQMIDDVLDVSRVTLGKLRLERAPAVLADIVEEAVASIRPAAEARRIPLHVNIDRTLPRYFVDRTRIQQIVWNLLTNAIKFSPSAAPVEVTLRAASGAAEIEVLDHGQGIPPAFLPHVFERFRQVDSSPTRQHSGIGLGLALVKDLIELHGGTVSAESEEGRGSRFTVRLPELAEENAQAEGGGSSPDTLLRGVRVLFVDDREDARVLIGTMLRKAGAEVLQSASVTEALVHIESSWPHVVVTDIAMPERDGYNLLALIRERDRGARVPVIALTAQEPDTAEKQAMASDFEAFLRKPVAPEELTRVVARVHQTRRTR